MTLLGLQKEVQYQFDILLMQDFDVNKNMFWN